MSDVVSISEGDLIESVADALQYISYYHPMDYIRALGDAYEAEQGPAAKDAIAQILTNSRMCAEGHRPICQDTGIVNVFVRWGQDCRLESTRSLQDVVDEGVRRAYTHSDNKLRASILADPAFTRRNTRDNTPCVLSVEMVPGNTVDIDVAAKGGGSENKSKFKMLNPSDNIVEWVLEQIPSMGAGWCPPGMLGIGIGGTAEHCMKLAKQSLMDPIDMAQLKQRGAQSDIEQLRIDIYDAVNATGVGAQGLGGLSTVLDVKIYDAPLPRGGQAGGHDSQLRRHAPRAFHARRQWADLPRTAQAGRMAGCELAAGCRGEAGRSRQSDARRGRELGTWRPPAPVGQDADRARRGA